RLDPFLGGAIAVAEAARNLSCTGALPLALTDCLNFGNPEKPEVMGQFEAVVEGMARACRALGLAVVSGNVSFYNETEGRGIWPTPIVGMVGLLEEAELYSTQWFKRPGDLIALLGPLFEEDGEGLRGGEYPALFWAVEGGLAPRLDLSLEGRVQALTREAIASHLLHSAHDCSEGGLALALAEACITGPFAPLGAEIKLPPEGPRSDLLLFSEAQSRVIVSLSPKNLSRLEQLSQEMRVPFLLLGKVTAGHFRIEREGELLTELSPERLLSAWRGALEGII
ncbi:MAG: AIR synthase related protein, partial [Nitrospinota bacterium]